jgi:hypothetical protein
VNLPGLYRHTISHDTAIGGCHGETEETVILVGLQEGKRRLVRASGKSIAVAKDLGLTETAVRAWVRQGGRWRSRQVRGVTDIEFEAHAGTIRPFTNLFVGAQTESGVPRLPITQVIVGSSPRAEQAMKSVELLLARHGHTPSM